MNVKKDYYAILGVLPSAEDIVIRAAYRALAQRYHPDRNHTSPREASERMQEINEAYSVLSDPKLRSQYDQTYRRENGANDFNNEEESFRSAFEEATKANSDRWQLASSGAQLCSLVEGGSCPLYHL